MKRNKGFTLIELLVVISIMAVLATIALVAVAGAQKQGRDATRRSDLAQYRTALESYYSTNNAYYIATTVAIANSTLNTPLANFMSLFPADPRVSGTCDLTVAANYQYCYISDATGASFVLVNKLETGGCFYYCGMNNLTSGGKAGKLGTCTAVTLANYCP